MTAPALDLLTIGRSSVDLYGQQIGSRLEDIGTFAKSVGGCPANIAIGTARLGLKSGLITRVGDEQMGRFIREQLAREGVETAGVVTDPDRLTALVLLAVQDEGVSPMIFYRSDCADMALNVDDIDEALIASARAIVVTGTHFSRAASAAAQHKAIEIARRHDRKIVFDIDYRPNLWALAGHAEGFARYVKSPRVTAAMQQVLPACDLVVGTEEEIMIASGAETLDAALQAIRALTPATIVLKRGAMGCIVFDGPITDIGTSGIVGQGFPIEVYNVLGAGDAFMSGFLRGWLGGETLATAATWANACGAFAVSRLLCSPEYPTWTELGHFLKHGSPHRALRRDAELNRLHRVTTRRRLPDRLCALAIDHRSQLEELADRLGVPRDRIADFKRLAVKAAARVADGRPGFGMLLDSTHGQPALYDAAREGLWIARPVEAPGSRSLRFDGMADLGSHLTEWPVDHTLKCLCFYHPDDPEILKAEQEAALLRVADAATALGREWLIEIIAGKHGATGDEVVAGVLARLYAIGLKPDWWKLEPQRGQQAWAAIDHVIETHDPDCRGVLLLGLDAPEPDLIRAFSDAAASRTVRGFAIGRTIFGHAAENWLAGRLSDPDAVDTMAAVFARLTEAWQTARMNRP
jgi:5-dehydro-2-deoxygluconokinase